MNTFYLLLKTREFVTDPEKNTIWDTTYEETLNKSDSTPSSVVTQKTFAVQRINNICIASNENSTSVSQCSNNYTKQGSKDIRNSSITDKENVLCSNILVTYKENVSMNRQTTDNKGHALRNRTNVDEEDMEISEVFSDVSIKNDYIRNKTILDATMEFTKQFPVFNANCCDVRNKSIVNVENMEFTQQIAVFNVKSSDIATTTIMRADNMELTEQFPVFNKVNCDRNETILDIKNMEFTQQIPLFNVKRGDITTTTMVDADNMEKFPIFNKHCDVKNKNTSDVKNMEFAQEIPVFNSESSCIRNRTIMDVDNVEVTQQFPILNNCDAKHQTVTHSESIEFTQQIPLCNRNSCNTKNRSSNCIDVRELLQKCDYLTENSLDTKNNPIQRKSVINENDCGSKNRIMKDHNMKRTQQFPVLKENNDNTDTNMIITDDIEFSKTKSCQDEQNKTIIEEYDMEITQQTSFLDGKVNKGIDNMTATPTQQVPTISNIKNISPVGKNIDGIQQLGQQNIDTKMEHVLTPVVNKEDNNYTKTLVIEDMKNGNSTAESCITNIKNNKKEISCLTDDNIAFAENVCNDNNVNTISDSVKNSLRTANYTSIKDVHQQQNLECVHLNSSANVEITENTSQEPLGIKNVSISKPATENERSTALLVVPKTSECTTETHSDLQEIKELNITTKINTGLKTSELLYESRYLPLSPCIDDTQHLINYNLTQKEPKSDFSKILMGDLNPSFLSTKFMPLSEFSSDAFSLFLETTPNNQTHQEHVEFDRDCKKYKEITYTVSNNDQVTHDQTINKLKRNSSENIETEIRHKRLMLEDHIHNVTGLIDTSEQMETSVTEVIKQETLNISQENLTFSDSVSSVNDSFAPIRTAAKEVVMDITRSTTSLSNLNITDVSTDMVVCNSAANNGKLWEAHVKRTQLREKLKSFTEKVTKEFTEIKQMSDILQKLYREESIEISRPFKEPIKAIKDSVDSSAECSLIVPVNSSVLQEMPLVHNKDSSLDVGLENIIPLEEKIKKKQKSCRNYWNVLSIKGHKCQFDTLFKTIKLEVQVIKGTEIVETIVVCDNTSSDSDPQALFVHKIFKERLSEKIIKSAIGENYDVLTLLDYLYMNMQKMLTILKDFDNFTKRFGLEFDQNFRVTANVFCVAPLRMWDIVIDMSDIENITEDSITILTETGTLAKTHIKKLMVNCPHDVSFFKSFINNVHKKIRGDTN